MEGLQLRQVEERENLSELALNLRYTLNAKKVNVGKLKLDKQKQKIRKTYQRNNRKTDNGMSDFAKRVEALNQHFKNKYS
ncbi:hypothetical protein Javan273_0012 [Streptococcus phage Javan273]|nr:hypothetical protein BKX95_00260 [Streptococcus iniae]QBX16754.1 hypothetical protein Javan273_0012 [Streptococcus phage Javan273]